MLLKAFITILSVKVIFFYIVIGIIRQKRATAQQEFQFVGYEFRLPSSLRPDRVIYMPYMGVEWAVILEDEYCDPIPAGTLVRVNRVEVGLFFVEIADPHFLLRSIIT